MIIRHLTLGIAALAASVASAGLFNVNSTLLPGNEVPPVTSSATGTVVGTYDDVSNILTIDVVASGFGSNVSAAHIHGFSGPGFNSGVRFGFGATGTGSTSYSRLGLTFTIPEVDEANYLAGLSYVNIHTTGNTGGEVRGQLAFTPVPEPASMAILGLGLAAFRKRRASK